MSPYRPNATAIAAAVLVLGLAGPLRAADCPLDRAVYTPLDADDDWGAEEGKTNVWEIVHVRRTGGPSDRPWVLRLSEGRQKLAAEFAVSHPPGFGQVHVFMTRPPGGAEGARFEAKGAPSAILYYFGADLRRLDPDAESAAVAPPYVQLPGLSKAFWDWKRDGRRFVPPDGIWKLARCAG